MEPIPLDVPHGREGKFHAKPPLYIADDVYLDITDDILIGSGVTISREVIIYTHDHYHVAGVDAHKTVQRMGVASSPLTIGDNVYIGARAMILEQCHIIGDDAVIGAGSVVTRNVPPREIWAGNPARKIGEV